MPFPIYTAIFAGLMFLLGAALAGNVILHRRAHKAPIGNPHNDRMLERKCRAFGNFAEYTPLMLIAVFLLELLNFRILALVAAILFFLGRLAHAYSLLYAEPKKHNYNLRVTGMMITLLGLASTGLVLLVLAFIRLF